MEVQAELDRVATFKGGHVNSSILHGSQQRFPVKVGIRARSTTGASGVNNAVGLTFYGRAWTRRVIAPRKKITGRLPIP